MIEWMAQAATTAQSFLLTGRLYWLLGGAELAARIDVKRILIHSLQGLFGFLNFIIF